jgi:hypothetical protein
LIAAAAIPGPRDVDTVGAAAAGGRLFGDDVSIPMPIMAPQMTNRTLSPIVTGRIHAGRGAFGGGAYA